MIHVRGTTCNITIQVHVCTVCTVYVLYVRTRIFELVEDQVRQEAVGNLLSIGFDTTDEVWVGLTQCGH